MFQEVDVVYNSPAKDESVSIFDRRAFLKLSLATAAYSLCPRMAGAQSAPIDQGKVDVHHHILPPRWLTAYRDRGHIKDIVGNVPTIEQWTPSASIDQMDRLGIKKAYTSISTPGIWWGDVAATIRLARDCNEFAAQNVAAHAGRFGFFATLPIPDVSASLREIDRAFGDLKADGAGVLTSYDDKFLGDAVFAPIFDELNRRSAVVFVHPTGALCCENIIPGIPSATEEYLFNTTRAITSLLVNGTFSRCPNIRFIFTHAGGAMPMIADRIARNLAGRAEIAARLPNGALHDLQRQYYDVTTSTSEPTLEALLRFAPMKNILFGTDYPYVAVNVTDAGLVQAKLNNSTLEAIRGGNAATLLR